VGAREEGGKGKTITRGQGLGTGNWELFGVFLVPKGSVPSSSFEIKKKNLKIIENFAPGSPGSPVIELGTRTRNGQKTRTGQHWFVPRSNKNCLVDSKHETCQDIDLACMQNPSSRKGEWATARNYFVMWGGEGGAYPQLSDQGSFFSEWTYIGSLCHRYLKRCLKS